MNSTEITNMVEPQYFNLSPFAHPVLKLASFSVGLLIFMCFVGLHGINGIAGLVFASFPLLLLWAMVLSAPWGVKLDQNGITLLFYVFKPEFIEWRRVVRIEDNPNVSINAVKQKRYNKDSSVLRTWTVNYEGGSFSLSNKTNPGARLIEILRTYEKTREVPKLPVSYEPHS